MSAIAFRVYRRRRTRYSAGFTASGETLMSYEGCRWDDMAKKAYKAGEDFKPGEQFMIAALTPTGEISEISLMRVEPVEQYVFSVLDEKGPVRR